MLVEAAIDPGNGGEPLPNIRGEVVGVLAMSMWLGEIYGTGSAVEPGETLCESVNVLSVF